MVELIEPPDGESLAIAYLSVLLPAQVGFGGVLVAGSLPAKTKGYKPPDEVLVVRGTGGTPRDLIVTNVQLTLTAWAATPEDEVRASEIARRAHALIMAAEREGEMAGVTCSAVTPFSFPYPDPDPVSGRARYSATYAVSLRGTVL